MKYGTLLVRSIWVWVLCLGFFAISPVSLATTATGRTPGTFAVPQSGAATYTIPIWAPPGPRGVQPNLALVYSSQSGNGYLGVGWNLAGISGISRCNLTYAQDAAPAPISLSTSDGYCLDGRRLRLTGGTYGVAGSTYQTEIANFINVTAYGSKGNGPAYFIAQLPNGQQIQYGNSTSSQVLANGTTAWIWMENELSDPAGNTMTFTYDTANGFAVPNIISWTPTSHGASTYSYTMVFNYGSNAKSVTRYVAGNYVTDGSLLSSITINYGASQVKEYALTYQQSPTTSREELKQIQECATSTSNCLAPTAINYQSGTAGVSTSATTVVSSPLPQGNYSFTAHYDFNGDGYPDIAYQVGTTWYVAFGSASGYGTPYNTGITGTLTESVLFGDILGTGVSGILANHSGTWYYYTWNTSAFVGVTTGLAFDSTAAQFALADVDGDGLPDLVALYTTSGAKVTTRLNASSTTAPAFKTTAVTAFTDTSETWTELNLITPDLQNGSLRAFDFNGDGRQDLAIQETYCAGMQGGVCIAVLALVKELTAQTGGTFSAFQVMETDNATFSSTGHAFFANLNDDACTDAILYTGAVYIAGCNGTTPVSFIASYPVVGVMDWDGDGRGDLLEYSGSTLYVQLSNGNGFGSATATSIAYASNCQYVTFDANGDSLDDLGCMSSQTGTTGFAYHLHNGVGTPPDLMSKIVDGYGNSASPTYVSTVQSNYIPNANGLGTWPYASFNWPIIVTNEVVFSDPSSSTGGTYNLQYNYYYAFANEQGRGLSGFSVYQSTDSRNGLYDTKYFFDTFPYTGMQYQEIVSNSTFWLSQSLGTQNYNELSTTPYEQRYFPYFSNVTSKRWEVGGTENSDLITTASTNFSFDNYGNAKSIATTTTDNDPGSPYNGQTWTVTTTNTPDVSTSPWCLNLMSEVQVGYLSTVTGSTSVTRTQTFTPNATGCNYSQVVTEPSSGSYKLTKNLGYDQFGNPNTIAVTGTNVTQCPTTTPCTTTITWYNGTYTTGQLPLSVQDPSGATTQFGYNYSWGLPSSKTDPNGLVTSWLYGDGFGRKTQQNNPDGTEATWTYEACSADADCLFGNNTLLTVYELLNTDSSIQQRTVTNYDQAGRQFLNLQLMLSGTYNRNEVRYDSLGRVVTQYFPCTWTVASSLCSYYTTNSYDVLNRLTESQRPISSSNSTLQTTSYAYAGRTTTVTDPNNNTKTTVTDVNGWLRRTTDAYGYTVTIGYDAAGSKNSVKDSLSNTLWSGSYGYGIAAFLTAETDMDRGAWTYTVDALGEVTSWQDAKLKSFSATFDTLSRSLTRTEPDLFTQWTWGTSASSHNIGQLQSVCTGTGGTTNCTTTPGYSESETYDSFARPSQRAISVPGTGTSGTFTYMLSYNGITGLLDTLTYPTSSPSTYALELKYGYTNGLLSSVTDVSDTPNVTVWTANTQNPAGQLTQETLGNGIVTNRAYDAVTMWLSSVQSGVGSGSGVKNLAFLYGEVGNVTQRQDNNLGLTENIYYDNDYRLTSTKLNNTQNLSVTYDNTMGNITARSDVASGATWTYSPTQKHAVSQAGSSSYAYSYDANGNMTSRQGQTVAWTSYNYPTSISAGSGSTAESVALSYGPDRQRWEQVYTGNGGTETTFYLGKPLELVQSGGVSDYRHYIYAGAEPIAVYSRKTTGVYTLSYLVSDHQGSVAAITNSSGAVDVSESFTPFGVRRNPTTWSGAASNSDLTTAAGLTRQGYTFQTQLGLWMGMNHMNGRVQDAVIGRFLSADPHIPDPTNAQDYNRYSHVDNNPVTYADPSGFCSTQYPSCNVGLLATGMSPRLSATGGSYGDLDDLDQPCYGCISLPVDSGGHPILPGNSGDNAPPPGQYQPYQPPTPATVNGSFQCGAFTCTYAMGQFETTDGWTGEWLKLNLSPDDTSGEWVQSYIDTNTLNFTPDCQVAGCGGIFSQAAGNGQWFYDQPNRFVGPVSWVAQASYLPDWQNGPAFTFQWGFGLQNGVTVPFPPVVVQPWALQQTLIQNATQLPQLTQVPQ